MAVARYNFADTVASWLTKRFGSSRRAPWDLSGSMSVKADPVGGLVVSSYGLSQPVRTPRRFDKLADEGYTQNPPVFRAINIISTAVAGIPWLLYQRRGTAKRGIEIETHPLLDLMAHPNESQGWGKFAEAYVSYLYIAGNSYLWANRPKKGGAPVELWTMRPDRMRVLPDAKQFVGGYTYEINGQRQDFDKASILHTKTFAPLDDWYGMSPLVVAARSIDIRNAGGDWNLALLQNSGRVPGFFVSKERMGDTQFERMREQLLDRYTGTRNVGLPGLLEDGVSWVANGMNPTDMDWLQLSREVSRDIAMALGVPSELIGDSTNKTYSNYSEARASLYTETVLPLMDVIRDELNRWLVPMFDSTLYLDYDKEDIEALQEQRGRLYQWVSMASFLTVNEKRTILNYPDRPEGDVIVVPVASATLDEVTAGETAPNGGAQQPMKPLVAKPTAAPGRANDDGGGDDSSAPTPDGGMAGAVDVGAKAHSLPYDPLDDLLAGKVLTFPRPKAARRPDLTEDAKAAHWTKTEAARTPWYKSAGKQVAAQFTTEHTAVVSAIKAAATIHDAQRKAAKAVKAQSDAWTTLITGIHQDVGAAFAKATYGELQDEAKARGIVNYEQHEQKAVAPDTVALVDDWLTRVVEMMLTTGAAKVKGITDTTRKRIQHEIAQGIANEETIDQIVTRIDTLYLDSIIPNRSETIARTETISASNQASMFGARATGLDLDKEWIATRDGRTRPDHADADGQRVPLDQPFVVGGVEMDAPGASGVAEEDINCRCTQGYHVNDDNE